MNPIRIKLAVVASSLFLVANQAQAVQITFEDFEDSTVNYVLTASGGGTQAEFLEFDAGEFPNDYAYFGRFGTDGFSIPGAAGTTYNNPDGTGFFAANNTDLLTSGGPRFTTAFMDFDDIDISGFTNLTFSGAFAESSGDDSAENWGPDTALRVFARIDSNDDGDYVQIFGIEADPLTGVPRIDTDLNGEGDGTEINDTFQNFVANIAGTGNLLDLRVAFENFNPDFVDIALDSLSIDGDAIQPVPEPTSLALLGALAACGGGYRLRRRRQTAADVA